MRDGGTVEPRAIALLSSRSKLSSIVSMAGCSETSGNRPALPRRQHPRGRHPQTRLERGLSHGLFQLFVGDRGAPIAGFHSDLRSQPDTNGYFQRTRDTFLVVLHAVSTSAGSAAWSSYGIRPCAARNE